MVHTRSNQCGALSGHACCVSVGPNGSVALLFVAHVVQWLAFHIALHILHKQLNGLMLELLRTAITRARLLTTQQATTKDVAPWGMGCDIAAFCCCSVWQCMGGAYVYLHSEETSARLADPTKGCPLAEALCKTRPMQHP